MANNVYIIEKKNNTLSAEKPKEEIPLSLDDFISYFEQYAKNFSEKERLCYVYALMVSRMSKDKRDLRHYSKAFFDIYFNNLVAIMPEDKIKEIQIIKEKMHNCKKELDIIIKDSKVEDTNMISYLIGMMEGLL